MSICLWSWIGLAVALVAGGLVYFFIDFIKGDDNG